MKFLGGLSIIALALTVPAWCGGGPDVVGVPSFHKINDKVYRGGQPAAEGWQSLAKMGVKTVIDLREPGEHSTSEEAKAVEAAGMKYVNVPMKGVVAPSDERVSQALDLLLNSPDPVFVHCRRGKDRTGTIIACYRMSHDKWNNHQALAEAKSLGMSWTQIGLKNYIKSFQPNAHAIAMAPATVVPATQN